MFPEHKDGIQTAAKTLYERARSFVRTGGKRGGEDEREKTIKEEVMYMT